MAIIFLCGGCADSDNSDSLFRYESGAIYPTYDEDVGCGDFLIIDSKEFKGGSR